MKTLPALGAALLLALLNLYPPSAPWTRAACLASAGVLLLWLLWRGGCFFRALLLPCLALAGLFLLLPGNTHYDVKTLRQRVADAAARYDGTRLVRGGENFLGIDGAGLVRRSAIKGALEQGLRSLNPWLVRRTLRLWWSGQGAAAGEPVIIKITEEKSALALNAAILHPGDFLARKEGGEIWVYLGEKGWLGGDPQTRRVGRMSARMLAQSGPVQLLRWRFLEAQIPSSHP